VLCRNVKQSKIHTKKRKSKNRNRWRTHYIQGLIVITKVRTKKSDTKPYLQGLKVVHSLGQAILAGKEAKSNRALGGILLGKRPRT